MPKLGEDDLCNRKAGSTPLMAILAGQREIVMIAWGNIDTCETLTKFAQAALPRLSS
ncbi:hypothetical protein [Nocardia sp. NPDC004711]